jgi:hypothetical protein
MHTPENKINPDSFYENDFLDYEVYDCSICSEKQTTLIYKDALSSGNICEDCLTEPELGHVLGLNKIEFERYQNKCRTLKPIN